MVPVYLQEAISFMKIDDAAEVNRQYLYHDNDGFVEYVQHMGDDATIVNAARVSFGKQVAELSNKDKKLIKYLVAHKHTSTLEHNVLTMRFRVPLFVARQHMRHRTWSFNEISRRYTSIDMSMYEPDMFRVQHSQNRQASEDDGLINPLCVSTTAYDIGISGSASSLVKRHHKSSMLLYESLMQAGVCREQARGVLPQNMYTEYLGTVNLNNLIKFIHLRIHEGAQWEIRRVAESCYHIASSLWPDVMKCAVKN